MSHTQKKKAEIGNIIQKEIKKHLVSNYRLHQISTVRPQIINDILNGNKKYTIDSLLNVCWALGLDLELKKGTEKGDILTPLTEVANNKPKKKVGPKHKDTHMKY